MAHVNRCSVYYEWSKTDVGVDIDEPCVCEPPWQDISDQLLHLDPLFRYESSPVEHGTGVAFSILLPGLSGVLRPTISFFSTLSNLLK